MKPVSAPPRNTLFGTHLAQWRPPDIDSLHPYRWTTFHRGARGRRSDPPDCLFPKSGPQIAGQSKQSVIYWHRELPPFDAEAISEHVIEASSRRVAGTLAHRDELWSQCYNDVMAQVRIRLEQEVTRLGGNYAHVLTESVDSKHDDAKGEAWLEGRFIYMLYR